MDFNTTLGELRNKKNNLLEGIKDLKKSREQEIKEAIQRIEDKYANLNKEYVSEFNIASVQVYDYCKSIENYSVLNRRDISIVLSELISVFEGKNYVSEDLSYHVDGDSPSARWNIFMIMPQDIIEKIKSFPILHERYINHLLKKGLAIKLCGDWSSLMPNKVSFYKTDEMGRINQNINFKGFTYVKNFIDYVINFRMDNQIDEISFEELEKLKEEFILMNIDYIEDKYKTYAEVEQSKSSEMIYNDYLHKQRLLQRLKKKIENNQN